MEAERLLDNIFGSIFQHPHSETFVLKIGFWDDSDWSFWATIEDGDGKVIAESELGLDLSEALEQVEAAIAAAKGSPQ